jgi:hypothetical protein
MARQQHFVHFPKGSAKELLQAESFSPNGNISGMSQPGGHGGASYKLFKVQKNLAQMH